MSRAQLTSTTQQDSGGAVAPFVGAKNFVANGGQEIWQRGTSISVAASTGAYTSDRWQTVTGANQAITVSRQATSDTTNLPNIQYCMRYQRNSGQTGTGQLTVAQSFETASTIPFAGKTVTLSFYARAGANYSATANGLYAILYTGTGTDQNALVGYTGNTTNFTSVTLTTTWQRFTYTLAVGSTVTEIAPAFGFVPSGTAGANDYYEITGVQLEVGSVATPFSRAAGTVQGELALCQRYYFRDSTSPGTPIGGYAYSSSLFRGQFKFPQTMRTAPSFSWVLGGGGAVLNVGGTGIAISSVALDFASPLGLNMSVNGSGMTPGQAGVFYNNGSPTYFEISAEL